MQAEFEVNLTTLLRYDGWRVLYKISQSAYILHYCVIFWYFASVHSNGVILGKMSIMRATFGATVLSFTLGVVYYLLFDKPIRNLDRMVLFPSKISDSFLIKKSTTNGANDVSKKSSKKGKSKDSNRNVRFTTTSPIIGRDGGTVIYKRATTSVKPLTEYGGAFSSSIDGSMKMDMQSDDH